MKYQGLNEQVPTQFYLNLAFLHKIDPSPLKIDFGEHFKLCNFLI